MVVEGLITMKELAQLSSDGWSYQALALRCAFASENYECVVNVIP